MFWAPCLRVDFPIDASREHVLTMGEALDGAVTLLERTRVVQISLAFSGAALIAFEREKLVPLIDRVSELAAEGRIELLGTPAHGAFLPLVPADECIRQIELTDALGRRFFGDAWHPAALWPPGLGFSQKVAEVALSLDYSSVLVDEAAMRVWPAKWPGDRIDAIDGMPGVFLLPRSRAASHLFEQGALPRESVIDLSDQGGTGYLVTTADLIPGFSAPALMLSVDTLRTVRLEQLFSLFPLSQKTSPLPCSETSTAAELGLGVPFARWFDPRNRTQALRWRLMTALAEALRNLTARDLMSTPGAAALRKAVDRGWRESLWRSQDAGIDALMSAFREVRELLPRQPVEDIEETFGAFRGGSSPTALGYPADARV